jgi:3-oxoacyl-ACP reductase-like protein
MAKRKRRSSKARRAPTAAAKRAAAEANAAPAPDEQISYSALSLHELFEQQTRQMLDRTDLDEEQKQNILVAMSCPCCGAGAMSFTAKLKR